MYQIIVRDTNLCSATSNSLLVYCHSGVITNHQKRYLLF